LRRLAVLAVLSAALLAPAPASAVINGTPDGEGHPNVGGLVNATQYPDGTWLYCSGTLVSPTVFVTAAHCAQDGERVGVTFDTAFEAGDQVLAGTFEADPRYSQVQSDTHDLAVVVLDRAVRGIAPARLPGAGSLAGLTGAQAVTSVGYGAHAVVKGAGGPLYLYDDVRTVAMGTLNAINPTWLRISMNVATGNGGTCYGDSGGPNFLGTSDLLAAITVTGDAVCRSTNVVYRLDTASARDFLGQYVELP